MAKEGGRTVGDGWWRVGAEAGGVAADVAEIRSSKGETGVGYMYAFRVEGLFPMRLSKQYRRRGYVVIPVRTDTIRQHVFVIRVTNNNGV